MLGSVPNSADMQSRYLLNSAKAGQKTAEFSECWAVCRIQRMLGRYLLNSANAGQMPAEFSECWAEEVENILRKR